VSPFGGSFFERLFRIRAKRIVYDIDDLVFLGRSSSANRFLTLLKGPQKYTFLMKNADHVITCTPYLDSYVRKFNSCTTDISSTIRTDTYRPINRYLNDHVLTLGWSGSHSTVPYLFLLQKVFQRLATRHSFVLKVIGTDTFSIPGVNSIAVPWTEQLEVSDLQEIDIGVYPLPNEEWVLGKSGLKALQYMALGIPTVATAIGANYRIIENGVSGLLATNENEWFNHLENLIVNPRLRKFLGENARKRVDEYFSVKANQDTYLRIFQQVYQK
jgi:glycosyltransferase involved in cell wall biosynthesis